MKIAAVLAAAGFALLGLLGTQVASAQYPPPENNMICFSSQISVSSNTTVVISTTLRDTFGSAVVGQIVSFKQISGTETSFLAASTAITDASGNASVPLQVGSASGGIAVFASSGSAQCQVAVQVGAPVVQQIASATSCVFIKSADSCVIAPPSTGDAGLVSAPTGNNTGAFFTISLIALGIFAAAGFSVLAVSKSRG